ncbi:MAG: cache domain-containing protein, partial [Rhodocyclaceae bacterium]|nr:cache domain-containing protein [Rhodocyclaceae bacterium]
MNTAKRMSLRAKLLAITVGTATALVLLFAVLLSNAKAQLLLDREEKIRNLVESVHASVAHFEKAAREGRMSVDAAKKAALDVVRDMRYDKIEYFWITDAGKPVPTMIMHATVSALDGKLLDAERFNKVTTIRNGTEGNTVDAKGKNLFVAFVDVAEAAGHGYVGYQWSRPKADGGVTEELYPKLSYVKKFDPWGWVIGTGIYIDDVDALFLRKVIEFLAWGIAIGGGIALALFLVSRNILNTLGGEPQYATEITRRIASGNLTTDVCCTPGDKSSLLAGMKEMQDALRVMVSASQQSAKELSSAAQDLTQAARQSANATAAQ